MADYRYCVGSFTRQAGSGTQTVTGIADINGAFTPKGLILWSTVQTADGSAANGIFAFGLTDGTHMATTCTFHVDALDISGVTGQEARAYTSPLWCFSVNSSAATVIQDTAHNPAFSSGQFSLGWAGSASPSQYVIHFLAIGGDDVTITVGKNLNPTVTGLQTVTAAGAGAITGVLLIPTLSIVDGSLDVVGDWWANLPALGAIGGSTQGAAVVHASAFPHITTNATYQRGDQAVLALGETTDTTQAAAATVSSLGTNSFVLNWSQTRGLGPESHAGFYFMTIAGPQVAVTTITQPVSPGLTPVVTGFVPGAVCCLGVGAIASSSPIDGDIAWSFGASDGVNERASWIGDIDGVTTQQCSGHMDQTLSIVAASTTGTGGSTSVLATATTETGAQWTIDWVTSDGVARQFLVLAFQGQALPTPTPPIGTTTLMRWERVSPHLSTEQVRQIYDMFQVDAQFVGTVECPNPKMIVNYSDDGGYTWSSDIEMPVAQPGDYLTQFRINGMLGQARDRVWKVWSDAPVPTTLIAAYLRTRPCLS